jgi:hypothetical protein
VGKQKRNKAKGICTLLCLTVGASCQPEDGERFVVVGGAEGYHLYRIRIGQKIQFGTIEVEGQFLEISHIIRHICALEHKS